MTYAVLSLVNSDVDNSKIRVKKASAKCQNLQSFLDRDSRIMRIFPLQENSDNLKEL